MKIFKNYYNKEALEINLEQVVNMIRDNENLLKSMTMHRQLLEQGELKAAKEVKKSTPLVAVSFNMEGGKEKENCRECLYQLLIDFDAKDPGKQLTAQELERVFTILRTSRHTRLGYKSISGAGYHIIVPFMLPEGITIDMQHDAKRSEEIFTRVHKYINNLYSVWCDYPMDSSCSNVNRLTGLSYDPDVVYRQDAYPFCPTREELGIDADGNLIRMKTPRRVLDGEGKRVSIPLAGNLERAIEMVEQSGTHFVMGQRHDFLMRLSFILNRMGIDEDQAAQAIDECYGDLTDETPSSTLHSCYRSASDEFGVWMPKLTATSLKTEVIAEFLKKKSLRYDILTQKTQALDENGRWHELTERGENDLYIACCQESKLTLSNQLFRTVLNSNIVPDIHPLRDYLKNLKAWTPEMPDYIAQAAGMVHMPTPEEDALWARCFKKWFVAMVAGWSDDSVVNHQVLVFIGEQGIYKSTWLNKLLPPQLSAYVCLQKDVEKLDKDEQLRAAEYGLINLDEIDKLNERGLNALKAQITTQHIDVRASYGKHKEKRIRVASYVASGNKAEFLTDHTGNRRWLPFHVASIDSPYDNKMPYEGMYAQAVSLIEQKFNYWFDLNDISQMNQHVEDFMVPTSEEQLIPIYYTPAKSDEPGAMFITPAEIASTLTIRGGIRHEIDLRRLGAILTKLGFPKARKGHKSIRGYIAREHTPMEIDKMHEPDKAQ